jgi:nanoRNase/pAp phosphatase (c-di-AMP/oligoRNAs hydrolase)
VTDGLITSYATMIEQVTVPREAPDLDGLACAVAFADLLRALGFAARSFIGGRPDPEALFVAEALDVAMSGAAPQPGEPIVLVDASDIRGLPASVDPLLVVEVIDHRLHHTAASIFPNATLCIEPVGAAATLVAERFSRHGVTPSPCSAQLLQAAVLSNTQLLRGSVTTERDRAALRALAAISPLAEAFVAAQLDARRRAILADLGAAVASERKDFEHRDGAYILSQLEFSGARDHIAACLPLVLALGPRAMLNLVDVEAGTSALIVPNRALRAWVADLTGLCFTGVVAACPQILLRKQIIARLEGKA